MTVRENMLAAVKQTIQQIDPHAQTIEDKIRNSLYDLELQTGQVISLLFMTNT